ncbi:glutamine amidotransferase [Haladaptatus sp. R4]|uniref:glutamine amidotransferase n=1 Tax=Haladaptatus sp. R4 TaxID=1679489 RepID=UPI000AE5A7A0|nr:glutamine amidotransferase [Haladaptatus sp. R4]
MLPVEIAAGDDRVETPSGAVPKNEGVPDADLPDEWPHVLGYNRTTAKPEAEVWATVQDDPFLAIGDYGDGSSFAYATDCAPHWAPEGLLSWDGLPTLWERVLDRVC